MKLKERLSRLLGNKPPQYLSAVARHGALSTADGRIVDERGGSVMLRGMSLFWSQWQPHYFCFETVKWLRDDWKINVIRAPLGVAPDGYLVNPEEELKKIIRIIEAAIALEIYVVIDWHAHDPERDAAANFFSDIAKKYGNFPNIIYELWNEPRNCYSWQHTIKPYHIYIADRIRNYDATNLIIAGTQNWSRDVHIAANDPLPIENVAYALHFYAASHGHALRYQAEVALRMGAPLVVTEWGTGTADGDGTINLQEIRRWWRFLEMNKISYINWSISDRPETSAALVKGTPSGQWSTHAITPSGNLVRQHLRRHL